MWDVNLRKLLSYGLNFISPGLNLILCELILQDMIYPRHKIRLSQQRDSSLLSFYKLYSNEVANVFTTCLLMNQKQDGSENL